MPLYYIHADDGNGEDFDYVVEATSKDQAVELYKAYMSVTWEDVIPEISNVFILPAPTGVCQVLEWHTKGGVEVAP